MTAIWRAASIRAAVFLFVFAASVAPGMAGKTPPAFEIPSAEDRDRMMFGHRGDETHEPVQSLEESLLAAAQDEYDVTNYFLDLNFDEVARRINGSVTITSTSLVDGLQNLVLNLEPLMFVSAVRRGASVAFDPIKKVHG